MRALDLFCGAGGASMGLYNAGFEEVVGVDIRPQRHYPFEFYQYDAMKWTELDLGEFDFIWASPPCQSYSSTKHLHKNQPWYKEHPDLVAQTRTLLRDWGGPYIIENVVGAPLINPIMLCGTMFNLRVLRHRLFESNVPLVEPPHTPHKGTTNSHRGLSTGGEYITVAGHNFLVEEAREAMGITTIPVVKMGRPPKPGDYVEPVGHFSDVPYARKAMGIPWMGQKELAQAIPPAYSEYLGLQVIQLIETVREEGVA